MKEKYNRKNISIVSVVLNDFRNDSRVLKMAKTLINADFNAEVAALHRPGLADSGSLEGVPFRRVRLSTYRLPRFLNPIKFLEMVVRLRKRYGKHHLWIANDFEALVLYRLARMIGAKSRLIYDSHELQSHREGRSRLMGKLVRMVEGAILKKETVVFNVSPGIVKFYDQNYGLENQRLVMNLPERQPSGTPSRIFRDKWNIADDATIFIFQGKLGSNRGLEALIQAFEGLDEKHVLVVMGYGPLEALAREKSEAHHNIYFQEAVPHRKIITYTSSADWGISNVQNSCLSHYYCLPNKIFEYIQAGVPIISNRLVDIADLLESKSLGLIMDGADVEDIRRTIQRARKAGREGYADKLKKAADTYTWESQEGIIVNSVEKALNS
jgi:glycosyltransferase involved in cell wall biosynthesis